MMRTLCRNAGVFLLLEVHREDIMELTEEIREQIETLEDDEILVIIIEKETNMPDE